jgi:hypothetical protein
VSRHTVSGPMGELFGRDPQQFVINLVKSEHAKMVVLTKRMAERTGFKVWTTGKVAGKRFSSKMVSSRSDAPVQTALILCLWAVRYPGILKEEAARMAAGMPVGAASADAAPFSLPPTWGQAEAGEPVTLMAILTIAIPILVAVAPIVLPLLIDTVGGVVKEGADALKNATKPPEEEAAKVKTEDPDLILGVKMEYWLAGAAAVAAFLILR